MNNIDKNNRLRMAGHGVELTSAFAGPKALDSQVFRLVSKFYKAKENMCVNCGKSP